jgi:glycosyltransferase involved in cell wall biosynthesis
MELQKLVIASVLKPVTDTRMYEKFGRSISQAKKYEVNIIGFCSKNIPEEEKIIFHPIFNFNRISIKRFFAPIRFFTKVIAIKPSTIIITTHELLIAAVLLKSIFKIDIIYDIQENYYLNIKHTNAFPFLLRDVLARWVRTKEWIVSPFINQFLLAEKCYENELPFLKSKYNIIENKALPAMVVTGNKNKKSNSEIRLLFSGTIAESTGIFECLELAKNLHEKEESITLNIVGYCPKKSVLDHLIKTTQSSSFITLTGGDHLVEHGQILEAISQADFGLIYYPPNQANDHSIPTKLYEYLSAELPMIIEDKTDFNEITDRYSSAIKINYSAFNCEQILDQIRMNDFYKNKPGNEVLWSSEALKLLTVI